MSERLYPDGTFHGDMRGYVTLSELLDGYAAEYRSNNSGSGSLTGVMPTDNQILTSTLIVTGFQIPAFPGSNYIGGGPNDPFQGRLPENFLSLSPQQQQAAVNNLLTLRPPLHDQDRDAAQHDFSYRGHGTEFLAYNVMRHMEYLGDSTINLFSPSSIQEALASLISIPAGIAFVPLGIIQDIAHDLPAVVANGVTNLSAGLNAFGGGAADFAGGITGSIASFGGQAFMAISSGISSTLSAIGDFAGSIGGGISRWLEVVFNSHPIVIDLDGDGIETLGWWESQSEFDFNMDGVSSQTGWVGADDALLVFDANANGFVDHRSEIAFVDHLPGASTDLEGLAAFDTNRDGQFDAHDERFDLFGIWRDLNGNGVTETGEFETLINAGIKALDLGLNGVRYSNNGNEIYNTTTVTMNDGGVLLAGDVGFQGIRTEPTQLNNVEHEYNPFDENNPLYSTASLMADYHIY